jgi:hypothetical protein
MLRLRVVDADDGTWGNGQKHDKTAMRLTQLLSIESVALKLKARKASSRSNFLKLGRKKLGKKIGLEKLNFLKKRRTVGGRRTRMNQRSPPYAGLRKPDTCAIFFQLSECVKNHQVPGGHSSQQLKPAAAMLPKKLTAGKKIAHENELSEKDTGPKAETRDQLSMCRGAVLSKHHLEVVVSGALGCNTHVRNTGKLASPRVST